LMHLEPVIVTVIDNGNDNILIIIYQGVKDFLVMSSHVFQRRYKSFNTTSFSNSKLAFYKTSFRHTDLENIPSSF